MGCPLCLDPSAIVLRTFSILRFAFYYYYYGCYYIDASPHFFLLIFILVLFAAYVYCALHCNCIFKKGKKPISILISSALGPLARSASWPASALSLLCAAASAFNSRSPPLLSSYINSQFLLLFWNLPLRLPSSPLILDSFYPSLLNLLSGTEMSEDMGPQRDLH